MNKLREYYIRHQDFIEITKGYLGVMLLTLDACNGWIISNSIIKFMENPIAF